MSDPTAAFADLAERYPGSREAIGDGRRQRQEAKAKREKVESSDEPDWVTSGHCRQVWMLNGEQVVFYTIRALALALHRDVSTIRRWEDRGWIPATPWRTPGREGSDWVGKRLYTREFIEGVITIAEELGMLHNRRLNTVPVEFTDRVTQLLS